MNNCKICGMETSLAHTCHDCLSLTKACHEWMNYIKEYKKEKTKHELMLSINSMEDRISKIFKSTLKEWGI